jgi:N-acetylglucosamine-6-phosphate deacetylase
MHIIDLHTHGIGGVDTRSADPEDMLQIAEMHGREGVGAILLSLYPAPLSVMRARISAVKEAMERQNRTAGTRESDIGPAAILGVHLEGPFLNPARHGALDAMMFLEPGERTLDELLEGFEKTVRIVTVAPELPGALNCIRSLVNRGIIVHMGHSDASYEEAEAGFMAGATGITHLFNAMAGFHHRAPGISGFGLLNRNVYVEVIADPHHHHVRTLDLVFRLKGPDHVLLVSDSIKDTHSQAKDELREGGKLKGGSMTLTAAVSRLLKMGFDEEIVKRAVTSNPVRHLQVKHREAQ